MALLTALAAAYGGFGQGRQQAVQNRQNQEQIDAQTAYEKSQTALEQQKQQLAVDAYQRNLGIDPTTGKKFVLPLPLSQVAPGNKGKAATDQQTLTHLYSYANWLAQTGQTDQAATVLDRAKSMEADIRANNSLMLRQTLDLYNQGQQDYRTGETIAGALQRNVNTEQGANERNIRSVEGADTRNIRTTNTSMLNTAARDATSIANTQAHIAQQIEQQSNVDMRQMEGENAKATRLKQPPPYPNLQNFKDGLSTAIAAVANDPKQLQTYISRLTQNAGAFGPQLIQYGRLQLEAAARESQQAAQSGGSQAAGNPPPPRSFQNP